MEGASQFVSLGGTVYITGINFAATPGYNYSLILSTDGIDKTKKSNSDYLTTIGKSEIDFTMYIGLRECEVGE